MVYCDTRPTADKFTTDEYEYKMSTKKQSITICSPKKRKVRLTYEQRFLQSMRIKNLLSLSDEERTDN